MVPPSRGGGVLVSQGLLKGEAMSFQMWILIHIPMKVVETFFLFGKRSRGKDPIQ